ncbi:sulfotransferase [Thalassovita mangrovi]|uniref:Sulfotransferase family protein n=1 Tax=Thalassovita mangrovi TaxID=2692236 RepID=A0A6L8LRE9_9RHOB|nr:sulfotransferase [Thalassovita mangrovi]MYM56042.1 sulfotransferase family protein [Thalassovita mangrovi]
MSRLRVINLGLPKSGTTTLARALKIAGLKTADYRIRRRQTKDTGLHGAFVGKLMYDGYFHNGDPLALMEDFDAFTEVNVLREGMSLWPQTDWGLIDAIREHHPGARFLLSYRDPKAISDSMLRWSNLGAERLPQNAIPGLPRGYGETGHERAQWIAAHHAHMRKLFEGDEAFLEYDLADTSAPQKIGNFLGIELKWWGRANKSPKKQPKTNGPEAA